MSKKPKYTVKPNDWGKRKAIHNAQGIKIADASSETTARKIARALNDMEDKPKARMPANGVYELTLTVKTRLGRKHAELSVLSAFAKRDPDQCVFIVNHARNDSLQKRP
jgi:hypothetical protein